MKDDLVLVNIIAMVIFDQVGEALLIDLLLLFRFNLLTRRQLRWLFELN